MSTQSAIQQRVLIPPVRDLVESLTESASAALNNFDRTGANDKHIEPVRGVASATSITAAPWVDSLSAQSTSRFGKGGAFTLVVLLHALLVYALSLLAPQIRSEVLEPMQVVTIEVPKAEKEIPPPPVPVQRLPEISTPTAPVIEIAQVEPSTYVVAATPESPPAASNATGVPRVVSSVEYIREPNAKYPAAARTLKQRGTVMLRALIDADGHAREVNVHRTSGFRLLDDAAREAVQTALFKPYMENGHSVPVYVFIPIEFGAG